MRLGPFKGVREVRGLRPNALEQWAVLKMASGRTSRIAGLPKAMDDRRAVTPGQGVARRQPCAHGDA